MKRTKLIKHLIRNGCLFLREGGNHTVYYNPKNRNTSTVPRHREIGEGTARKICKDLQVEKVL